jgi:phospholipid transport system substrate-binding protein
MFARYITLIAILGFSFTANAGPPIGFIKGEVEKVRALLKIPVKAESPEKEKIDDQLRSILNPVMNFERLSENALRNHWTTLSEVQRSDFVALFRALVFHSYLQKIRSAEEAYTIDYVDQQAKGAKAASVTAISRTKTTEIELVFHILREENGLWSIEDIVIDEVSLVENYREQFDRIIKKSGFVVLLEKMIKKLNKIGGKLPILSSSKVDAKAITTPSKK